MNEFENIKSIWKTEKADALPNSEAIKSLIKKYQIRKKRKAFILAALALVLLAAFILVIIYQDSSLWTIVVGQILILFGAIIVLLMKIQSLKKAHSDEQKTNRQFLKDLENSMQKKSNPKLIQIIGLFILSIGLGFYVYEIVSDNLTLLILTYTGIVLYAIFIYFVFRPWSKKISKQKINRLLESIDHTK